MTLWRPTGLVLSTALTVGVLAGCGGGSSSTSSNVSSGAQASGAPGAKTRITRNWTRFFNASTPTAQRVSLLQHGQKYKAALVAQAKSPLAHQSSAKVSDITLTGPSSATVKYSILVAGKPALKRQAGTAVKSGGTWKVSDQSFCHLLSLQGNAPPPCSKA
jgi:hypothetical protein